MKKTKLSLAIAGLVLASAIMVTSCKKKDTTTTPTQNNDTSSSTDNNTSQTASKDLMNIGSEAIDNGNLTTYKISPNSSAPPSILSGSSGTVTIVPDWTNKHVTVTFSSNFIGYDGHTRSGTVYYDWSGSTNGAVYFKDAGFYVAVTTPLNDYKVDGNLVTINKKHVRNLGAIGANSAYTWSDTAAITIAKANNGGTITWNYAGTMVLMNSVAINYPTSSNPVAGVYPTSSGGFIDWAHAVIGFTGNASGTTASGSSYTANITSMVVYNFYCSPYYPSNPNLQWYHPPVAGSIDFTPQGVTTRTINYGNGTCDDSFTITIGTWSATFNFI